LKERYFRNYGFENKDLEKEFVSKLKECDMGIRN
jgi:hypothetical protein